MTPIACDLPRRQPEHQATPRFEAAFPTGHPPAGDDCAIPAVADPRLAATPDAHPPDEAGASEARRLPGGKAPGPEGGPSAPGATPGELADAVPDRMTLHTKEAYRLFTGRAAAADAPAIAGGRRFAAVLKSLWHLSANDNPYADWILVSAYDGLVAIRQRLAAVIAAREDEIGRLERRGLALAVMSSRNPQVVELGFRSPYGYATAAAIVEFDTYVRVVQTLVHKDRLSDAEGRAAIREVGRALRALFLQPIRWEHHLRHEALRPLSRSDFLPGAGESARQRVRAAAALFGDVPRAIFTGATAPRHSRRRVQVTGPELRLLEQAAPADADLL